MFQKWVFITALAGSLAPPSFAKAQEVVLETAAQESAHYSKAIQDILQDTNLYFPFEGQNIRATRRAMRKLGLTQTQSKVIDRHKQFYDRWEGPITLGAGASGRAEIEFSSCENKSRRVYFYSFRISDLDAAEMKVMTTMMRRYQDSYASTTGAGKIMHHASREDFITGVAPQAGQMITATVTLNRNEPANSVIGQLSGRLTMECP